MKVIGWIVVIIMLIIGINVLGYTLGWFGRATQLVADQVDPYELQRKYEWFKDASAQLDVKQADIQVYEHRLKKANCSSTTDRTSREQCMVWDQETAGVIASYNALAGEYNAAMVKWNYRFTNVGQLPQGATVPLPREYKPYETGE